MQNIFDSLISSTYQLDIPMPVVSVTELNLCVEKDSTYIGAIEVYNSGGGFLLGLVENVNGFINFKEETLKGNKIVLEYSIDAVQHTGYLEDTVIITYNGGEIFIPVHISIEENSPLDPKKKFIPKATEQKVTFCMDGLSYHPEDTGYLTITNPFGHLAKVKLSSDDGYMTFKESSLEVVDTWTVEFTFKITKLDRMLGRVPLKTNPKIEVPFYAEIQVGNSIKTIYLTTYLTELGRFPAAQRITSRSAYKALVHDITKQFCAINLLSPKSKYLEELLEKLKVAINFDRTNVQLRIFYCFLALETNNKNQALKEIYELDHYLIHFDMEHQDTSDILLLFIEMTKGDSVQDLVRSWKINGRENW
ncbi:MAG: hypothetical protein H7X94_12265, partial [Vallitaleaceae bacterium]|nr:hypothetical protein [Vallitaleaceae bacterium]